MRIVPAVPLFLSGLFLGALLLFQGVSSAVSPPANPHAYFEQPEQCPRCHLYSGSNPDPGRISTASIEFCLGCHRAEGQNRTHPLKVHPEGGMRRMKVPPEYHLGDGEHVVCLTCHSAHGPFVSNVRAFPGQKPILVDQALPYYRTYFLRRPTFADKMSETLCNGCHRTL